MKQYKLIKEYPGSPVLDTIIEFNKDAWYAHFLPKLRDDDDLQSIGSKEILSYKEFWQEITKPEYTILSLIGIGVNEGIILKEKKEINAYIKDILGNKYWVIHSVKRLSDGEIFTIGDKYNWKSNKNRINIIRQILLEDDKILIHDSEYISEEYDADLDQIEKVKKPLFTTEDGVDIYVGNKYFELIIPGFHNEQCVWNILPYEGRGNLIYNQEYNRKYFRLWFSSKEKAEEYMLLNRPCLSLNDFKNNIDHLSWINNVSFDKLRELVKQKLKQ